MIGERLPLAERPFPDEPCHYCTRATKRGLRFSLREQGKAIKVFCTLWCCGEWRNAVKRANEQKRKLQAFLRRSNDGQISASS